MPDFAFVCPGSCQAAVVRPRCCGNQRCTMAGLQMVRVSVIYKCLSCNETSEFPSDRHAAGCPAGGQCLVAHAVVPPNLQFPVLDPPEENRTYSSVWGNDDETRTNHARSTMGSAQGWSARENNADQWMVMDAGSVVDSISGLVVSNRKDGYHDQLVTSIAIDVGSERGVWTAVGVFETNLAPQDHTAPVPVHFASSVSARFVRVRPLEWQQHISLRCALMLTDQARGNLDQTVQHRTLIDVNQLPARVPVYYIPGGAPPPPAFAAGRPLDVAEVPTGEWEWCGRRASFRVLAFNGNNSTHPHDNRIVAVRPGQQCSISVGYQAQWDYNHSDYCPGCIVQLYYGMTDIFSQGLIEHGIGRRHEGEDQVSFVAPTQPGLYYITPSISLQYNYVNVHHPNEPRGAIAAVRVLPTRFEESVFVMLPRRMQDQIRALLVLWNRRGEEATAFSNLPREIMYKIFTLMLGQDP